MTRRPVDLVQEDAVVRLAQHLVRIPSQYIDEVLAEHAEVAQALAKAAEEIGLEVQVVEPLKDYPVVVASTPESDSGPTIGVIGHYSTVAIGDRSEWTQDPVGAEIVDGKLYGRGSADQKGGIAAVLHATKCLLESGLPLKGRLRLLLVPGEGSTEMALWPVADQYPDLVRCDTYIDSDGGPGRVTLAHGGFVWLELITKGKGGHSGSLTSDGSVPISPVKKMVTVLARLQNPDWMTTERHPLFGPEFGRYTRDGIVDVNVFRAGSKVNIIPNEARAQIDLRLLPSQTSVEGVLKELDAVLDELRAADPDLDISYRVLSQAKQTQEVAPDHPIVKAMQETYREQGEPEPKLVGSIGDGRPPVAQFGPVIHFGACGGSGVHAPNEYTTPQELARGARLHASLYTKLLT